MARLCIAMLTLLASLECFAQDHRAELWISPAFNQLNGNYTIQPDDPMDSHLNLRSKSKAMGVQMKLMYRLSKKLLLGATCAFAGGSGGKLDNVARITSKQRYYGVELQWSTSRYKPVSFYSRFNATWVQSRDQLERIRQPSGHQVKSSYSGNTAGGGLGIGLNLRVNYALSINLFELAAQWYGDDLNYGKDAVVEGLTASMGLVFGIHRKR